MISGGCVNSVSVIIPTWNRAAFIKKAINSALKQTFSPLEIIVCDDGSTDNTFEIINSFKDSRIRWTAGPRSGRPAIPRNRGIAISRGEWIAFLDSDDEWLPEKLETQLSLAVKLKCKAVCSNAYRVIPNKGTEGNLLSWHKNRLSFYDLIKVNNVICSSAMIHRSCFSTVVGFPEEIQLTALEDYALWLRIATQTDFAFIKEPMTIYHDDAVNSIRKEKPDVNVQRQQILLNFLEWGGAHKEISKEYLTKATRYYNLAEIANRSKFHNLAIKVISKLSKRIN